MKWKSAITALSFLIAGTYASFGQTTKGIGLKFAATDPDAATSSLAPAEVAGVVPQANWNNLTGATGSNVGSLVYDNAGTATPSTITVTWSAPNTWRSGANNGFPAGPDKKLLSGYLDTGNTAANGVTITVNNIDPAIAATGYDVYVYFVSDSNGNRGGGYTINDGVTNVLKYGSTMGTPSTYVEDPGTDRDLSIDGNYLRFRQLTGTSFTLKSDTTLTSPNGTRAPVNAIQIVPSPLFGPDITTQPRNVSLYAGKTAKFTAAVDGWPKVTTVKWTKDNVDLVDNGHVSGATNTSLVINNVSGADEGDYRLVATSTRGTGTSNPAHLSIVTPENSNYINTLLADAPVANWRFNDADGVTDAFDYIGGLTGTYSGAAAWGSSFAGPRPTSDFPGFQNDNTAVLLFGSGAPGYVEVPTPTLATNTATFIAWINPAGAQLNYSSIIMTRSGTQAGLGYTTTNQLGYTWNGNTTWTWNSGLVPPDNQWTMVAVVIQTNKAILYMGTNGVLTAAINPIPHTAETWGGLARIGDDTGGANRQFNGSIDEVAVFNRALSFSEVSALYAAATGIPQNAKPIVSPQPVAATRYAGAAVSFQSGAAGTGVTLQWKRGTTTLVDDARISGSTTDLLTIKNLSAADAGDYTLVATNPNGTTTSAIAHLTVLASPNAYVSEVLTNNPLSYWRLNDTDNPISGAAIVADYWGGRNGTYGVGSLNGANGVDGPRPAGSFGAFEPDNSALQPTLNTANTWATVPALGIATNTMTMLAWINPSTLVANAGIVFARAGQAATGLGLAGTGNLGYTWLDQASTYNFASGITPPTNQWSLAAVSVTSSNAILYLINGSGLKSATNSFTNAVRNFSDTIRIGGDPNSNNRTFNGKIDEVAIFDHALTGDQLNRLFQRALGSVPPSIAGIAANTEAFVGDTVQLTDSAVGTAPISIQWQKLVNDVWQNVQNGANISGANTATLTISNASASDAAEYRIVASNALGSATSDPTILSLLAVPPAPAAGTYAAAVIGANPLSYWRLNETGDPTSGTLLAYDSVGHRHGVYGTASQNGAYGIAGPRPADGFTKFEDTNFALAPTINIDSSWVTVPALNVTTDTLTVLAWIKPTTLVANAGIVFWRNGQPATGLDLGGAGNLGYHWLDQAATYSWNSGLTPPVGQWSLVGIVVQTNQATAYLLNAGGLQSAVNTATNAPRAFTDTARIGNDPNNVNRTFDGVIDEVAVFNAALTADQIQGIYNGQAPAFGAHLTIAQNAGQITISWDLAGQLQSTTALNGANTVWTNETTTGNTLTTSATGTAKFYRVVR